MMRVTIGSKTCAGLAMVLALILLAGQAPAFEWQSATPESQGMSAPALDALWKDLQGRKTSGLLIVRNDKIVFEKYAEGSGPDKPHYTASMAKALVGGMSLLVAMNDGLIDPDDPAGKFVPQWKDDPRKAKIKIRHLATHTSGIEDAEQGDTAHDKLPGWKGAFWAKKPDPFTIARDQAPVLFEPGSKESYSNPGMAMLAYAVTASLKDAPQKDIRTLLKTRIMDPIGVPAKEWSVGYGQTYRVEGLPLVANWGGGGYTARATARVGRLMLRKGDWDGQMLIESSVVERVLKDGLGWWTNRGMDGARRSPSAPDDAFWGAGAGHQILLVVPSLSLIVVRNGNTLDVSEYDDAREKFFFAPLMKAVSAGTQQAAPAAPAQAPYPQSPVIKGIRWAPAESVIRLAQQSDIWPMTWGDDDIQYTSYGDGFGFKPFLKKKISLGVARVLGNPPGIKGENIAAPTIETVGDGKKGGKASGILMVDGVLYLIERNVGNAQLAWSEDRGKTWTRADWKCERSFGCPTFINFGKNYAGARDSYVYIVSFDGDSAYEPADRFVLARAPREQLRDGPAYEFFVKLDENKQPVWSQDVEERGSIFDFPGKCYRSGITYNAALKRYLWVQILPSGRNRQSNPKAGSLGVYDAPEPWGPWTTVFYAENWDINPGETGSFPTKWMSEDGKKMHLVFSGDDSFSVRGAELELAK